jgi:hypothetical protein
MQIEVLNGGWIKQGSVIAFPHEWQRPAKTEEWVYETLVEKQVNSIFVEFIAFPWATLIDLIQRRKIERVNKLIAALDFLPRKKSLIRVTACQHINIDVILDLLSKIQITDLYWAHKTITNNVLGRIRLHPLALYPVAYFDSFRLNSVNQSKFPRYLYSFIGAYDEHGYISNIRNRIFSFPINNFSVVIKRDEWHFENAVYKKQIEGLEIDPSEEQKRSTLTENYIDITRSSQFVLCPSGAGSNSIRFWECLAFGITPILLSDDYEVPDCIEKKYFLQWKEDDFEVELNSLIEKKFQLINQQGNPINPISFIHNVFSKTFDKKWILNILR